MTIATVAERSGLSQDTLRYYERIGLIPPVKRNAGGYRDYDAVDCAWIDFIKCMRGSGIPIEALTEYVDLFRKGDSTIEARKGILIEQRDILMARVKKMKKAINRLDGKIARYESELAHEPLPKAFVGEEA